MPPLLIPIPTPFPVGPVNVYLIQGKPLTLIDTGPKHADSLVALESGLAQHGVRIEDIQQLILTHHHVDHVGLARQIADRSGAKVVTHPYNVSYLEDYEAERMRQMPFYTNIWAEAGTPPDILEAMKHANEGMSRWLDPVTATELINEGDTVDLGGVKWTVHHTPGHAGGLVCFHNRFTHELIANDHLLRDISSNPILEPPPTGGVANPRPKRLVEYIHHMQRMADLQPLVAYPGHGEVVYDIPALVRKRLAFHRRRADKIYATLAERPLTLWELTKPMFPRLTRGIDFFLAHSEVLGHIDILVEEGKVRPVRDGELVRWQVTS